MRPSSVVAALGPICMSTEDYLRAVSIWAQAYCPARTSGTKYSLVSYRQHCVMVYFILYGPDLARAFEPPGFVFL